MTSHDPTVLKLVKTDTTIKCAVCDTEAKAKHHHYVCKDCGMVVHQSCIDKAPQTLCLKVDTTPMHKLFSRRISWGGLHRTTSMSSNRHCSFSVFTSPVSPMAQTSSTPSVTAPPSPGVADLSKLPPGFAAAAAATTSALAALGVTPNPNPPSPSPSPSPSSPSLSPSPERRSIRRESSMRMSGGGDTSPNRQHKSPSPSYTRRSSHHGHSRSGSGSGSSGIGSGGSVIGKCTSPIDGVLEGSASTHPPTVQDNITQAATYIQACITQQSILKYYRHMCGKTDKIGSILEELVTTEENYVKHMKNVLKFFIEPLSNKLATSDRCMIPSFMPTALATLVPILSFTVDLLASFKQEQSVENVANTFMKESISSMVSIYTPFLENHFKLSNCLLTRRTIPDLDSFVKQQIQAAKKAGIPNFDLQELLITPIQRISRYKMLIAETSPHAPFYGKLKGALERISSIANDINKAQTSDSSALIDISVDYTVDPFVRVYSLLRVGDEIWCGCDDGTLQVYNSQTREHICRIRTDVIATVNTTGTIPASVRLSKHSRVHSTVSSDSSQHESHEKRVWVMCLCSTTGIVFCGVESANLVAVDPRIRGAVGKLQLFSSSKSVIQSMAIVSPGVVWCASGRESTLVICGYIDGAMKNLAQVPLSDLSPNCLCYVPDAEQVWVGAYGSVGVCCSKTNKLMFTVPVFGHKRIAGMTLHEGKVWCVIGGRVLVWQPSTKTQNTPASTTTTTASNVLPNELLRPQLLQRLDVCPQLLTGLHLFAYPNIMQILVTTRRDNGLFLFDAQTYEVAGASSVKTALSNPVPITFGPNIVSTIIADTTAPSLPNINPKAEDTNTISLAASCIATAASMFIPTLPTFTTASTSTSTSASASASATASSTEPTPSPTADSTYTGPRKGTLDIWANSVEGPRLLVVFRIKMLL
ncbi:hypothetical protein Pelo_5678 [Pelomyxa schiedti]|nr:hypothetical protein Pelo_5678 [Pelomyxa schiedti]